MNVALIVSVLMAPMLPLAYGPKAKPAPKPKPKVELVGRAVGQAAAPVVVPLSGQAKAVGGAR